MRTGHFRANSICYSPRFYGWARGPRNLWAKKRSGHTRKDGEYPSIARLCWRGHLVGQTGKTTLTRHFWAKSMRYSLWFRGWPHGPGVSCDKNRPGYARDAGERPSVACLCGRGQLVAQTGKMMRTGNFKAKLLCYSPWFRGWAGGGTVGRKLTWACQRGWGTRQCCPFVWAGLFGWSKGQNGVKRAFWS